MRFGKMMACVAVLGCTSALNLETQNTLEADSQNEWTPSRKTLYLIKKHDIFNNIGFLGAFQKCANAGQGKICEQLEDDIRLYDTLSYYDSNPGDVQTRLRNDKESLADSYKKFSGY